MKLALVHDWLNQAGGAEVVLEALHAMYPAAPVFTAIADAARVPAIAGWDVRASWMDRLPGIHAHHQPYLPLYPLAWETTRLLGYDVVLSNKSGFCHGVRTGGALHICYCLTPTRFVWQSEEYVAHEALPRGARLALDAFLPILRRWDRAAADRVDHFVAISTVVRDRIAASYGRDSTVIHPPTDVERFRIAERYNSLHADSAVDGGRSDGDDLADDYYLIVARLVPYKRIDLAIDAFNRLGRRLVIVGDGRDRPRLERLAGPTIEFRGRCPEVEVDDLLARCRALVWPGVEDYGLVPVEAMASGRPVIARRAGGVLDTVVEGRTGLFFDAEDAGALAAAVRQSDGIPWDPETIRDHAMQFGRPVFEARLRDFIAGAIEDRYENKARGRSEGSVAASRPSVVAMSALAPAASSEHVPRAERLREDDIVPVGDTLPAREAPAR